MRDLLDNLDKITEAPKPVAKISASTFLGFMYQDNDDISELGERMLKQLMDKGNASISLNDLMDGTGFFRADQIENIDQIPADLIDDDDEIADPATHLDVEWM